jgi:hypothetical protein
MYRIVRVYRDESGIYNDSGIMIKAAAAAAGAPRGAYEEHTTEGPKGGESDKENARDEHEHMFGVGTTDILLFTDHADPKPYSARPRLFLIFQSLDCLSSIVRDADGNCAIIRVGAGTKNHKKNQHHLTRRVLKTVQKAYENSFRRRNPNRARALWQRD